MALIHASVEALDGSDALACGFVAFCKGCNGNGRVLLCLARMHRLAQNDYIKTKHKRSLLIHRTHANTHTHTPLNSRHALISH